MAGIRPVFEKGPITFLANVNIAGGQLVEPDAATGRIKPATADSTAVLGVATGDASAFGYANSDTTDAWGNTVVNAHYPPNEVAVAYQGVWKLKNGSGATIAFGALVASNGSGEVKALGAGAFGTVIGRCLEPNGIAAGAKGKILLGTVGS